MASTAAATWYIRFKKFGLTAHGRGFEMFCLQMVKQKGYLQNLPLIMVSGVWLLFFLAGAVFTVAGLQAGVPAFSGNRSGVMAACGHDSIDTGSRLFFVFDGRINTIADSSVPAGVSSPLADALAPSVS